MRNVNSDPQLGFVNAHGYVSLFPFLLQILSPNSDKLGIILNSLTNPDLLYTPYGLRSLAKNSPLYKKKNTEHDAPYWRGEDLKFNIFREAIKVEKKSVTFVTLLVLNPPPHECDISQPIFFKLLAS